MRDLSARVQEFKAAAAEKKVNARRAFTSWGAFKQWIQVQDTVLDAHGHAAGTTWSNEDLDPTPPEKRTWNWYDYCAFYFALSFGNWTLGSSMIGVGLNVWQSIVVIFVSQVISSAAMLFNSRCASVYHVGYPIVARSVFGMYGSYYFVGARAVLAIIWYGVQLYSGASLVANMLRAVFGHYYTEIPNHIPESMGITSAGMLAFFLFWLCHLPFTFFRPYQLAGFFWFKTAVMIPAVWGLFIFCMVNTKGQVGLTHIAPASGAQGGWFWLWAINVGMGNTATLITNQPDLARWSKTKTGAMYSQLFTQPLAVTLAASLGILATAAMNNKWGLELWNQWDLLDAIMDHYWSSGARFAVFLCAACWTISIFGTNIAANMIPFGADSSMLFPRYITIPRGQMVVEFLGFAICPWKIMASAAIFTEFLSGYGLFMASVVAIMVADYWIINKGNMFVAYCYDGARTNPHYYYKKGWNIQAVIAYLCGIALPFPGFVGTLGAHVSETGMNLGHLGWLLSFFVSFFVYIAICYVWPTQNQKQVKEMTLSFEAMADALLIAPDGTSIPESLEGKPAGNVGMVYDNVDYDAKGAAINEYQTKYDS